MKVVGSAVLETVSIITEIGFIHLKLLSIASPSEVGPMQNRASSTILKDACFKCHQEGHWSKGFF
jgi:hypothetical protein